MTPIDPEQIAPWEGESRNHMRLDRSKHRMYLDVEGDVEGDFGRCDFGCSAHGLGWECWMMKEVFVR